MAFPKIMARMIGAKVTGIEITPKLLALAKGEEKIAGISGIDWKEGDKLSWKRETKSNVLVMK